MKKVDVIFPAYINATIGPTGTLRRLLKNKDYLKKRGYELEIFTYDYLVSGGKVEAVDFTKGLSQRSKVKQYKKKLFFFNAVCFEEDVESKAFGGKVCYIGKDSGYRYFS